MLLKSINKVVLDRIYRAVALLLLVLAGWWCGQLVWALVGMSDAVPDLEIEEAEANPSIIGLKTDLDGYDVAKWSLFGKAGIRTAIDTAPQDAPKTNLNLTLVGAFVGQDPEHSTALIVASGNNAEIYRVDDGLPGGAKLKSVYQDRVLIDYRGRTETLFFEAQKSVLTEAPKRPSQSAALETLSPQALIAQAKRSPSVLVKEFGIKLEKGEYALDSGKLLSLLSPIGGRRGDIIKEWNGVGLTGDPQQDVELIIAAMNDDQSKFSVVLHRKGVPILLEGSLR